MEDFDKALSEVKPAFGAITETLEEYRINGIINYGAQFSHLLSTCMTLVEQVLTCSSRAEEVLRSFLEALPVENLAVG